MGEDKVGDFSETPHTTVTNCMNMQTSSNKPNVC